MELLIVVIILGILAAIVIPQFTEVSEDAKLATLDRNLAEMRKAIELHYHQHDSTYPGAIQPDGSPPTTSYEARVAFREQMNRFSSIAGATPKVKSDVYKFGPYTNGEALPKNSFMDTNQLFCDILTDDISIAASGGPGGWKFYILTGRFIANDGDHDDN